MADITVTINGKTSLVEIENMVKEKVLTAAAEALRTAGEQHIQMARENVQFAYRFGEPKISLMYAWALIPKDVSSRQTTEENLAMAQRIRDTRTGMVKSGNLLRGIQMTGVTRDIDSVQVSLLSRAPYSQNLEWGILFDKERRDKQRRFFTSHLQLHTLPTLVRELYKNLGSER